MFAQHEHYVRWLYCITHGSLTWNSKSRKTPGNGWFTVQTWYSSHVIHPSLSPSNSFSISPATFEASSLSKPLEFCKWSSSNVLVSFRYFTPAWILILHFWTKHLYITLIHWFITHQWMRWCILLHLYITLIYWFIYSPLDAVVYFVTFIYHVNTLIYSLTSRCGGVFCSLTIIMASIISSNSFLFSRLSWSWSNTLKQTTTQAKC